MSSMLELVSGLNIELGARLVPRLDVELDYDLHARLNGGYSLELDFKLDVDSSSR